jgi:YbgC/YbaW family acyl-CoA thioester hydrolase
MANQKYPSSLALRIDWSELDYFGHVNNVSFFKYIQAARVHYWEQIGLNQTHRETNIGPMLASCKCDFKQPLFFPGTVTIHSSVGFIKKTSFGITHQLVNDEGLLVAEANDIIVLFDFTKNKKHILPEDLKAKIITLEEGSNRSLLNNLPPEIPVTLDQPAIAQLAKVQQEEQLFERFPNIECISDTLKAGEACLTLYINDEQTKGIPAAVPVKVNGTTTFMVKTELVTNMGNGKPHVGQLTHDIAHNQSPEYLGSLCCLVESTVNPNFKGVVTSGHIFTKGRFMNFDGIAVAEQTLTALSNHKSIGTVCFQQMTSSQDLAIVEIPPDSPLVNELKSFSGGAYQVSAYDTHTTQPNITILSRNKNQRDAYLLDLNVSMKVYYNGGEKVMRNLILIGSTNDKQTSKTVSNGGDSGSCVFHKDSGKLIGMLMGGNDTFTFVLPLEQTLLTHNYQIR